MPLSRRGTGAVTGAVGGPLADRAAGACTGVPRPGVGGVIKGRLPVPVAPIAPGQGDDRVAHPLGDLTRLLVAGAGQQGDELVAAVAGQVIADAQLPAEAL